MTPELTENAYLTIWHDIAQGGTPFWVLLTLFLIWVFKDQINKLIGVIINLFSKNFSHKTKFYKSSDLKKHQLFKDLDYWLKTGIEAIHLTNNGHENDEEYIKGKEEIAKDVARIKFEVIKESLTTFINENDFDNIDYEVAHQYLLDTITKIKITEMHEMLKAGIPSKFLEKYNVFSKIGNKILLDSIKLLYQKDIDFSVPTRIYLSLSNIDGFLNISFNSIADSINSINGDLKGEEYHGHILGRNHKDILKPPSTQNNMAALEKLNDILKTFNASRATISKLYNMKDDDITSGQHSCIYEVVGHGITSVLEIIQDIPNNIDPNVMVILNRGENIAVDISKFSKERAQSFLDRGAVAIIMSPIYNEDKLDGVLCLDYFSLDDFEKIIEMDKFDEHLYKYADSVSPYIIYPENYKF